LKDRPEAGSPARGLAAGALFIALALASCAKRPPVLIPPATGVEAVAGFGSASFRGEEAEVKGKFAFLFRKPGWGRVEAFDPLGRTIYYMIFAGDDAYLVIPRKKVYAQDRPEAMIGRFLGFSLRPDEILGILGGQWAGGGVQGEPGPGSLWTLARDGSGRVVRGGKDGLAFEVREFFPGAGVPRAILFSRPGTSGRMKVLALQFNPPPRPEAFETSFLKTFTRRSWEEIQEIARDES
jgi:outer membrane biogenesis lipoprotein LolB